MNSIPLAPPEADPAGVTGTPRHATERPGDAGTSHRDNNFNFLRLVLAALVMVQHAPELKDGDRHREILTALFHTVGFGTVAVNGFFLLSGYLIVQSWQRNPRLLEFLKKRVLRIYPGFVVASLISALVVGPLGSDPATYFRQLSVTDYVRSLLLLNAPAVPESFPGQPFPVVNGSLWTIAYEFRCYLAVALFGILGILRHRAWWLIATVLLLLVHLASLRWTVPAKIFPGSVILLGNAENIPRLFTYFFVGGCFYLYRDRIRYTDRLALPAAILVLLAFFRMETVHLILPTLGAYVFLWFAFKPLPALRRFGASADISYGVYLYGWPVQKLLYFHWPQLSPWFALALAMPLVALCGWLSWTFVEGPFLRLKGK
ncbi:MAG: acyltransferase [Capsulimonadales bacterium]|nr:acyltransferase [Capsulimonadales bacterium]